MIGLETALAVVATTMVQSGKMTWRDLARVMSVTPARIGRAKGQGEEIAPGAVANLCFVSADTSWQVHRERQVSRSDNTPFVGKELLGQVRHTIYRGKPTVLAGQLQF